MARILILTGGPLWSNPRSQKEAAALAEEGHEVIVGGVWFDAISPALDHDLYAGQQWRFIPVLDFRVTSVSGRLRNLLVRAKARTAREAFVRTGKVTSPLHGYGASEMLQTALQVNADLTIVHSEAGLWAGSKLLDRGMRVGADFEDWYSEDLLPAERAHKPIARIRALERRHLRECTYCTTTSNSLAQALVTQFGGETAETIYNAFPPQARDAHAAGRDRGASRLVSFHWFSQTIGPGRGLELLFESLQHVQAECEIHLRGRITASTQSWLRSLIPSSWARRVTVHTTVPNAELPFRIEEHDVGLALETSAIRSRDLTVTNKFFQYLQAGLAVVATATSGQREVFSQLPDAGQLIPESDPISLAAAISSFASDRERLRAAKAAARTGFESRFGWRLQRKKMIDRLNAALGDNQGGRVADLP